MVGMLREQADDLAAAAESLREALRQNPAYAEAMVALASIYERLGEFSRSRALAEQVAKLALPSAGALDATTRGKLANLEAGLADAYREAGALPTRSRLSQGARPLPDVPRHPVPARDHAARGGLPRPRARRARARAPREPGRLDAAVQTGLTLYTLGRGEEAIAEWRAVLERDRTREDARMYLRMVARALGKPVEAAPERLLARAGDPAGKLRTANRFRSQAIRGSM
jgi:tetratricopeptide (TPR) repeat protein